ncbi:DNA cytosine methyltransferase [Mucilaginibacter gossypii]|uniref:Cytosine-specific methyltransferase n=1 Tax=Mucilaginibacter gossypii TaxID=551996 RepID=A0A1G8CXP8_9SPHI|nr:DNA cytosine methyltransferase [Mucilaginibacter gossypii]SDH50246.1 DNA (cytosine-5)-methyltransferase 1 [Mucilaginibacter gossypii]
MSSTSQNTNYYIDLFAGCGGLSLGLHNAGWKGLFAIEKNKDAFNTLKHNLIETKNHFDWPTWLPEQNHEIDAVLNTHKNQLIDLRGKVDLVAGGPPCQGFSSAGRRNEDDVRNGLIRSYLKFIMYVRPKVIFFENVKGFTLKFDKNKSKGKVYSEFVLGVLRRLGYEVDGKMLDFSKYGIPQKRTRFILVGIRKDIVEQQNVSATKFYRLLKSNKIAFCQGKNLPQNPKLGDAISDLLKSNGLVSTPDRKGFKSGMYKKPANRYQIFLRGEIQDLTPNSHSFAKHSPAIEQRLRYFLENHPANRKISDVVKAQLNISKHSIFPLAKNAATPTLTTLPDDYIHYQEPRILTVREYARIQSFPDWYQFTGKYTTGGKLRKFEVPRYTQIGNAIPPLFGEQSGLILKQLVNGQQTAKSTL